MSPAPAQERYLYSGQTVGASAHFHRLDDVENLNHNIPALGASVLPVTGGLAKGHAGNYCYMVDYPRHRTLLAVRRIDSSAEGRELPDKYETEVTAEIESIHVLEKLHIDLVQLHMLSTFGKSKNKTEPIVSTNGNKIQGMRLGNVNVTIALDEEPLKSSGSKAQLAAFYKEQTADYRRLHAYRFGTPPDTDELASSHGIHTYSLVREITLDGPPEEMESMWVEGYSIRWKGFGRIILGEVVVKGNNRQITLVRLAMGSNGGGTGSVGCGQTNGQLGSS